MRIENVDLQACNPSNFPVPPSSLTLPSEEIRAS